MSILPAQVALKLHGGTVQHSQSLFVEMRLLCRYIEASYRRALIAQEVLGYNADIVCLQEVDEKAFYTYFLPVMQHAGAPLTPFSMMQDDLESDRNPAVETMWNTQKSAMLHTIIGCSGDWLHVMLLYRLSAKVHPSALCAGFDGRYTNKAGKTAEGSATFFRKDRYRAVALKEMKMNELFANILADPATHTIHSQFLPLLQSSPVLVQALSRVRLQSPVLPTEKGECLKG